MTIVVIAVIGPLKHKFDKAVAQVDTSIASNRCRELDEPDPTSSNRRSSTHDILMCSSAESRSDWTSSRRSFNLRLPGRLRPSAAVNVALKATLHLESNMALYPFRETTAQAVQSVLRSEFEDAVQLRKASGAFEKAVGGPSVSVVK